MKNLPSNISVFVGLSLLLVGCSPAELLQRERSLQFESKAELSDSWEQSADWLPDDSSNIRVHESSAHDTAILSADSSLDLDTAQCAEVQRQSGPAFDQTWSPENVYVERIFSCGTWAVMKTADGWYAWTPNHPDERK